VLVNAVKCNQQLSACFVLPNDDSMDRFWNNVEYGKDHKWCALDFLFPVEPSGDYINQW
jgi:ribonucleotide reductase alpha subunit